MGPHNLGVVSTQIVTVFTGKSDCVPKPGTRMADFIRRGRKPCAKDTDLENKTTSAKWKINHRDHVREYNKRHYQEKKALAKVKQEEEALKFAGV